MISNAIGFIQAFTRFESLCKNYTAFPNPCLMFCFLAKPPAPIPPPLPPSCLLPHCLLPRPMLQSPTAAPLVLSCSEGFIHGLGLGYRRSGRCTVGTVSWRFCLYTASARPLHSWYRLLKVLLIHGLSPGYSAPDRCTNCTVSWRFCLSIYFHASGEATLGYTTILLKAIYDQVVRVSGEAISDTQRCFPEGFAYWIFFAPPARRF